MARQKTTYATPAETLGPSYFCTMGSKTPEIISWEDVYKLITQDSRIEELTVRARKQREQDYHQKYCETKARCGAITPAAQCQGGHNAANLTALTGVSLVDLDHVPTERMADTLRIVKSDRHTMLCHTTASGEGIRILFRYASTAPEIAYRDAEKTAARVCDKCSDKSWGVAEDFE